MFFPSYEVHFEFLAVFTNFKIFKYFSAQFLAEMLSVFCEIVVGRRCTMGVFKSSSGKKTAGILTALNVDVTNGNTTETVKCRCN